MLPWWGHEKLDKNVMEGNKKYYTLNAIYDFNWFGRTNPPFVFGNSTYTSHEISAAQKLNWAESRQRCKDTGSDLVSIESKNEWRFLKNTIQKIKTVEYYIGLKKDSMSGEWKWLSDNSKVSATRRKVSLGKRWTQWWWELCGFV